MAPRYQPLGPLLSGSGSRAHLALALSEDPHAPPQPCVLVYLYEEVLQDPEALQAVRRETRRAAQLDHPNIVRCLGLAERPEGLARVVEYADAESLRRILEVGGRLRADIAARIAADAATGVHYAHVAGNDDGTPLVHGDLRPETVLVGYSGATKVSGYGALAAAPREASGKRVKGRRQHCAPEQVVGGREAVNVQTDVYLLGVLLFELLSGEVPFGRLPMNEFDTAVLTYPPPPVPSAEHPPALEAVIRRAMAKKAFDRYPTALAFREAVEKAMATLPPPDAVARYVGSLFPDGDTNPRRNRQRMLEAALAGISVRAPGTAGPDTPIPPQAAPPRPKAPPEQTAPRPLAQAAAPLPPEPQPAAPAPRAEAPPPQPAAPPRRRSLALPLTVVALLAAAAGAVAASRDPRVAALLGRNGRATAAALPDAGAQASAPPAADAGAPALASASDADAGAAVAATPILNLDVDPPVSVTIDGVAAGRTPLKVPVAPGRHLVRLSDAKEGISLSRLFDVPAEGLSRQLYLSRGFVTVDAPGGSQITIDGRSYGSAPLRDVSVWEGNHKIVVLIGQSKWQESFEVSANQHLRYDVDFQ